MNNKFKENSGTYMYKKKTIILNATDIKWNGPLWPIMSKFQGDLCVISLECGVKHVNMSNVNKAIE